LAFCASSTGRWVRQSPASRGRRSLDRPRPPCGTATRTARLLGALRLICIRGRVAALQVHLDIRGAVAHGPYGILQVFRRCIELPCQVLQLVILVNVDARAVLSNSLNLEYPHPLLRCCRRATRQRDSHRLQKRRCDCDRATKGT
jgi:hypothetical protein